MVDEYIIHHDASIHVHITISVNQVIMGCMVYVHAIQWIMLIMEKIKVSNT